MINKTEVLTAVLNLHLAGQPLETAGVIQNLGLSEPERQDRDLIRAVLAGLEEGDYCHLVNVAAALMGTGIIVVTAIQTAIELQPKTELIPEPLNDQIDREEKTKGPEHDQPSHDAHWDDERREACIARTIKNYYQTGSWPNRGDIARADGVTDKDIMASGRYHTVLIYAKQRVEAEDQDTSPDDWNMGDRPAEESEVTEREILDEMTSNGDRLLTVTGRILTVDQLTALMDIDPERWEIEAINGNKWDGLQAGGVHVTELIQVKFLARLKPINALDAARELIRSAAPLTARSRPPRPDGLMMALGLVDLHVGKLTLPESTGDAWNLELAEKVALEATEVLLARAQNAGEIARILLPWGNDLIHTEDGRLTTRGTPQDTAALYYAVNQMALRISHQVTEMCREVAPVDVVMVPGNHARRSEWWLGEVLSARYAGNAGITVDNTTRARKYISWQGVLLGLTHGDGPKQSALPALMAQEAKSAWSGAHTREWLIGHLHHTRVLSQRLVTDAQDQVGVTIRQLPTVCGNDVWHEAAGYVGSVKRVEAPLYHRQEGYIHSVCYTRPQVQSPPNNVIHFVEPAPTSERTESSGNL